MSENIFKINNGKNSRIKLFYSPVFKIGILGLLWLFIPFFEIKILLALGCILWLVKRGLSLTRTETALINFIIFLFAYIYSPYWQAPVTSVILKYIMLVAFFLIGLLWSWFSSGDIKFPRTKINAFYFLILAVILSFFGWKILGADIPWRGDEDFHLNILLDLAEQFKYFGLRNGYPVINILYLTIIIIPVLGFLAYHYAVQVPKKREILLFTVLSVLAGAVVLYPPFAFIGTVHIKMADVLRYPYFSKWLNLLFVIPNFYGDIRTYRAVPFISAILISWYLFFNLNKKLKHPILSLLLSLALTTTPVLFFYSNILYLEMPFILLMLFCMFNLKTLLFSSNLQKIRHTPVWYCLLWSSFIKETVFIYLILILILRAIYRVTIFIKTKLKPALIIEELKICGLLVLPGGIYLFFRIFISRFRPYGWQVTNLVNWANYADLFKAMITQFGFLLIVSGFGLLYFLLTRKKFLAFTAIVLTAGITVFFFVDDYLYMGLSRWNLYLIPILFFISVEFLGRIPKPDLWLILSGLVIGNLIFVPYKSDGTRLPNWGAPHADTAEYTYPYDRAISWISQNYPKPNLILAGHYYNYGGIRFYFHKYGYYPGFHEYFFAPERFNAKTETELLASFFTKSPVLKFSTGDYTILYHSVNNLNLDQNAVYGGRYKIVKQIQNSLHSLYIFNQI